MNVFRDSIANVCRFSSEEWSHCESVFVLTIIKLQSPPDSSHLGSTRTLVPRIAPPAL
jgi:hypothetical protein